MPTAEEAQKTYSEILARAAQDAAFRKEFVANPRSAVEKAFGIRIPDGHDLKVVVSDAKTTYVAIPFVPTAKGELSDDELESVAGGKGNMTGESNFQYAMVSIGGMGWGCAVLAGENQKETGTTSC